MIHAGMHSRHPEVVIHVFHTLSISVPNSTSARTFGRSGRRLGVSKICLDLPSLPLKLSGLTDLPN